MHLFVCVCVFEMIYCKSENLIYENKSTEQQFHTKINAFLFAFSTIGNLFVFNILNFEYLNCR